MSAKFVFNGLEELKAQLRALPEELTVEASHIVEGEANAAAVAIKAVYGQHRVTGHLQDGVYVSHFDKGRFGAGAVVHSSGRHAWWFDNGTQARHWVRGSAKSTGTMWGKTPPTHVFVKTMIAHRRAMYTQLADLLERHGLRVTGSLDLGDLAMAA
jgi:hypothetical protein